jgi:hypothetical protein
VQLVPVLSERSEVSKARTYAGIRTLAITLFRYQVLPHFDK